MSSLLLNTSRRAYATPMRCFRSHALRIRTKTLPSVSHGLTPMQIPRIRLRNRRHRSPNRATPTRSA
eukprot:5726790-Pleurochrysis_carterae.AAC.2